VYYIDFLVFKTKQIRMTSIIGFYTLAGKKYADYFPRYFAEYHKPGTGPEYCLNCATNGCIDDIFVGYCFECAFKYKGYRGIGFSAENTLNQYAANKNFFLRKVLFVPADTIVTKIKLWKVLSIMGILGLFAGWLWFCK
jgi:hypothetical protein